MLTLLPYWSGATLHKYHIGNENIPDSEAVRGYTDRRMHVNKNRLIKTDYFSHKLTVFLMFFGHFEHYFGSIISHQCQTINSEQYC